MADPDLLVAPRARQRTVWKGLAFQGLSSSRHMQKAVTSRWFQYVVPVYLDVAALMAERKVERKLRNGLYVLVLTWMCTLVSRYYHQCRQEMFHPCVPGFD